MHIYIHEYMYITIIIHVYLYIYIDACVFVYIHRWTQNPLYKHADAIIDRGMCVLVHMWHVHAGAHIYVYIYTCIRT